MSVTASRILSADPRIPTSPDSGRRISKYELSQPLPSLGDNSDSESDIDAVEDIVLLEETSSFRKTEGSSSDNVIAFAPGTEDKHLASTTASSTSPQAHSRPFRSDKRILLKIIKSVAIISALLISLLVALAYLQGDSYVPQVQVRPVNFLLPAPSGIGLKQQISYLSDASLELRAIGIPPELGNMENQLQVIVDAVQEVWAAILPIRGSAKGVLWLLQDTVTLVNREMKAARHNPPLTFSEMMRSLRSSSDHASCVEAALRRTVERLWTQPAERMKKSRLQDMYRALERAQTRFVTIVTSLDALEKLVEETKLSNYGTTSIWDKNPLQSSYDRHRRQHERMAYERATKVLSAIGHGRAILADLVLPLSVHFQQLREEMRTLLDALEEPLPRSDEPDAILALRGHMTRIIKAWNYYIGHWNCLEAGENCLDAPKPE